MRKTFLVLAALAAAVPSAAAQPAETRTTLVSPGGDDWSQGCDVTDDGTVAFTSAASTLVGGDTNERIDVFLARPGEVVERVSVTSRETQTATHSSAATVSDDGTRVAFEASAYRLTNRRGRRDHVFVRDTGTGRTAHVTVAAGGGRPDAGSGSPAVTGDGTEVFFHSAATNLTGERDHNDSADVFARHLGRRKTVRLTAAPRRRGRNVASGQPSPSRDGRFVAFVSAAPGLVPGDDNGALDVFRYDRRTRTTRRVSVGTGGGEAALPSYSAALSADGRFVAFATSTALTAEDVNGVDDVYVHDVDTQRTELASAGPAGAGNGPSGFPSLSHDGRYVAFSSFASDLVPGDTNEGSPGGEGLDGFVRDLWDDETTRVTVGDAGRQGDRSSGGLSISPGGSYVCWSSDATNLVAGDDNGTYDVFLRGPLRGDG
jgi:Tol biopolymer transport system component